MKKLSVFETGVIGFFIGVIVAAYTTFVISNNAFLGEILNWLSLRPVFNSFNLPESQTLVGFFIFTVLVFTLYGIIIGFVIKKINKSKLIIIPIALVALVVFFEQNSGKAPVAISDATFTPAAALKAVQQTPKQYFGNEALGDLNADGKEDIAFLIHRKDDDRGTLYYLTTALAHGNGKIGTNLIFLGDKVNPQSISIRDGIIDVILTTGSSTTTESFFAQVINGNLEKITATTTSSI